MRRRALVVGLGFALTVTLGLTSPIGPAGAAGSVTATPSSALVHGQEVALHGSGFTPGAFMGACQAVLVGGVSIDDCSQGITSFTSASDGSFTETRTVRRRIYLRELAQIVDCAAPSAGCVLATAEVSDIPGTVASAPITFDADGPLLTTTPEADIASNEPLIVNGSNLVPNTTYTVRQCLTATFDACAGPGTEVTTNAAGAFSTSATLAAAIGTTNCIPVPDQCEIRAVTSVTPVASAPLVFDPTPVLDPAVTVEPDEGLGHGQGVTVSGTGFYPGGLVYFGYCLAGETNPPACTDSIALERADASGAFSGIVPVRGAHGTTSCSTAPGTCMLRIKQATPTQGTLAVNAPLSFDPAASERQPDGQIVRLINGSLIGENVYNTDASGQERIRPIAAGGRLFFAVRVQNDSVEVDDISVVGGDGTAGFTVRYFVGFYDVTSHVTAGTLTFAAMNPTVSRTLAVNITADSALSAGTSTELVLTFTSGDDPATRDAVRVGVVVV